MKKLVVILYLLTSITMQAKEIKENRIFKKVKKTEIVKQVKPLKTIQVKWGVWDAILDILPAVGVFTNLFYLTR